MTGAPDAPPAAGEVVLAARGLARSYGPVKAVTGVDLTVRGREIYGLVGPDGAGKTTTIRMLTGHIARAAGAVSILGHDPLGNGGAVRDALGYMPQQYSLYGDLTVDENLRFFASMFCLPRDLYRERREQLLGITRLARFTARRADALSGGMYKKLALACALLHRPRLLVLDEPTNGVDPVSRREFWDLLAEFVADGMAVLLSTPYMDEAARCHRVGLIHAGRLLLEGEPAAPLAASAHGAVRVDGGEREAVAAALQGHARVLALSPSGARVRVVVARGGEDEVAAVLQPLGARLHAVSPDFEDLFLARLHATGAVQEWTAPMAAGAVQDGTTPTEEASA
ncbi:MAG: ABC transporter ATP-binding protein [Deltaproteobacteria bacterium]|nr:ABC transporter ATP-binding protein [Deltaproteobacteria bacterium]